jgi:ribose/xylose/arabinose/galactoside ABC-type transport system permease subunit
MRKNESFNNPGIIKKIFTKNEIGTLLTLVLMFTIIGSVNFDFFAVNNLIDVLRTVSYFFMIAAPLTCLMISGGLDLSIGAVTSFGGVICAWCMVSGVPVWISIILALLAGGLIGVINALIVVRANIAPFIVTLGMSYVINGFILVTTLGIPVLGFQESFKILGQGRMFGTVHWTIISAALIGVFFHIILTRTKFGRTIYAVGGNQETAKLAGINVARTKFSMYVMVSVFAALTGVFMASRFNSAQTGAGTGTELTIIAAVIIGGTSLFGGSGSIAGTFMGTLLLATINNGLVLMHVSSYWQSLIFGTILIISLFIDKYRRAQSGTGL